jgi:hypothetical protein
MSSQWVLCIWISDEEKQLLYAGPEGVHTYAVQRATTSGSGSAWILTSNV